MSGDLAAWLFRPKGVKLVADIMLETIVQAVQRLNQALSH
jgi:hypothetical protein